MLVCADGAAEEKLVDVSKGMGQVLTVQRQLFLCLRALVARMPFARLRPFLPFMITEMASSAAAPSLTLPRCVPSSGAVLWRRPTRRASCWTCCC
jgi:hypothetical protein